MLVDHQIKRLCRNGLLDEWAAGRGDQFKLIPGVYSSGYIASLSANAELSAASGELVDPLSGFHILPTKEMRVRKKNRYLPRRLISRFFVIEPGDVLLGKTAERVFLPADIAALAFGLSRYSNCGAVVSPINLEPGFAGPIAFQIANVGKASIALHVGFGILNINFFKVDRPNEVNISQASKDIGAPKTANFKADSEGWLRGGNW